MVYISSPQPTLPTVSHSIILPKSPVPQPEVQPPNITPPSQYLKLYSKLPLKKKKKCSSHAPWPQHSFLSSHYGPNARLGSSCRDKSNAPRMLAFAWLYGKTFPGLIPEDAVIMWRASSTLVLKSTVGKHFCSISETAVVALKFVQICFLLFFHSVYFFFFFQSQKKYMELNAV